MLRILMACGLALALSGCATVTRGTDDQIQINSDPQGAVARTSLGMQCITPCTIKVSRKDEFSVTIEKPGFEPQSVFVKTQLAGSGAAGFAGNVLLGGVIGMGVDAATGATLEHVPNPVQVVLRAVAPPPLPAGPQPRGRAKQPPVAARPPTPPAPQVYAPPVMQPVASEPPEPQLSERDRALNRVQ